MIKEVKEIIKLNDGREISLSTGKLAKQAHGSVELRMGKTHMYNGIQFRSKRRVDFLPLTVDYREKFAADARFRGFLKESSTYRSRNFSYAFSSRILGQCFQKIIMLKYKSWYL